MKTIHKYPLQAEAHQRISLPETAEILSVESQYDDIVLYALVDTENLRTKWVDIYVFGTGHNIPENLQNLRFMGTVKLYNGDLMFHIFIKDK